MENQRKECTCFLDARVIAIAIANSLRLSGFLTRRVLPKNIKKEADKMAE
jgi:hypothetical protein